MDDIRRLFAEANGVDAGWFSFNSKGACPVCKGTGQITYDMAFAEPVVVVCEECGGHRYNPTALSYCYHGKNVTQGERRASSLAFPSRSKVDGVNIEDVMTLTIEQAMDFFDDSKIRRRLQVMMDVGLGYLTLVQPTSTLSGGEIQRIKLSANRAPSSSLEMAEVQPKVSKLSAHLGSRGRLYILDEPSTGLHAKNIELLLTLLRRLVSEGNTVVIVEHRLELIAQADWIIDLGPDGGTSGGEVVFQGTPQEIIHCERSKTGQYLMKARETYTSSGS